VFEPSPGITRQIHPTRHGQVHARLAGQPGHQPALVLLHMSPVSGAMYEPVMTALAQHRLVLAPDRLGFGASDKPAAPLDMPQYAESTLDLLDALAVAEFDVLGTHTGAVEAIELATRWPSRVRKLVLVALPVFTPQEVATRKERFFRPPPPAEDGSHLQWHWQRRFLFRQPPWDLPLLQWRLIEELIAAPALEQAYFAVYDYPTAERLTSITQPLLVLAPHDDLIEITRRARPLPPPHAQYVDLPDMGLDLFAYHRDAVVGLLSRFFGQTA
jgi:pimeloyl-ACP methyl ester carboxylesterase